MTNGTAINATADIPIIRAVYPKNNFIVILSSY